MSRFQVYSKHIEPLKAVNSSLSAVKVGSLFKWGLCTNIENNVSFTENVTDNLVLSTFRQSL